MANIIISSGITSDGIVIEEGCIYVSSGGTANNTVLDGGAMNVLGGAEANDTTVNSGGRLFVNTVDVNSVTVRSGGSLIIYSNCGVSGLDVARGGTMVLSGTVSIKDATLESGVCVNNFYLLETNTLESGFLLSSLYVPSRANAILYQNQTMKDVVISSGGSLYLSGGIIEDLYVMSDGGITLGVNAFLRNATFEKGAKVNGFTLLETNTVEDALTLSNVAVFGGYGNLSWNQSAGNITVNQGAILNLGSGGSAEDVFVSRGGILLVSNGAFAENCTLAAGAQFNFITLAEAVEFDTANGIVIVGGTVVPVSKDSWNMTSASLCFSVNASDTLVCSNTRLILSSGATALHTVVSGTLSAFNGGFALDTVVCSGGTVFVSGGGVLDETVVNSGGSLVVSQNGTASVVFNPWQGTVSSGYRASVTFLERDANVYYGGNESGLVGRSDSFDSLNIVSGNTAIVYSGGFVSSAFVNEGAVLHVLEGGTAFVAYTPWSGSVIADEGAGITMLERDANIYCCSPESGLVLRADGIDGFSVEAGYSAVIYADGSAAGPEIHSGGRLELKSGGTAENVRVNSGGSLVVSGGATVSVDYNPWSGTVVAEEGADVTYLDRDANIYYGGDAFGILLKGDALDELTIHSGYQAIVHAGGAVRDVVMNSGGKLEVFSGGSANVVFNPWSGGTVVIAAGASVTSLARDANIYFGGSKTGLLSRADSMSGLEVSGGNSAIIYSGGMVRDLTVDSSGYVLVNSGGVVENASIFGTNRLSISSGGFVSSISLLNGASVDVMGGGTVCGVSLDSASGYNACSMIMNPRRAYAEVVFIGRNCLVSMSSYNSAKNIFVGSGGEIIVGSYSVISNTSALPGGIILLGANASANDLFLASGASLSLPDNGFLRRAAMDAGAIVNGFRLLQPHLLDGDQAFSSVYVGSSATLLYRQKADHVTVDSGAVLSISGYGLAENVFVSSGGGIRAGQNSLARNVTLASGANINNFTMLEDTTFSSFEDIVFSGTVVSSNSIAASLSNGQAAVSTLVLRSAGLTVHAGASAEKTTVFGNLSIQGSARDVVVSSGGVVSAYGCNLSGMTVLSGGRVSLQQISSGMYGSQVIGSFSDIVISSGGTLTAAVLEKDATVEFCEGAVISGWIRNAANLVIRGDIDAGSAQITMNFSKRTRNDGTMFSDMSSLIALDMDLVVDTWQDPGTYVIGANAAGFSGTITVKNASGTVYGQLSLEQSRINWNISEYVLSLNDSDELCLTIDTVIPENDGILFYKNGVFVSSLRSSYELNLNQSDFDQVFIASNGFMEETRGGCSMTVLSGGSAVRTRGGAINVMDGGRATGITNAASIHIYEGGFAEDIVSVTSITVESGGRLIDTVTPYGEVTVSSGGVMENVQGSGVILYGLAKECHEGYYSIYSGGYTLNATNGFLGIYSGGVAEGTYMNNSLGQARITVYEGGLAKDTTMEKGTITVLNGGLLVGTELLGFRWYSDWQLEDTIIVSEGGVDWKTKNIRGVQHVVRGGVASETELTSMGIQHVSNGGLASETRLVDGGRLVVSRGGTARDIHVVSDGAVIVESLGFVQNIVLDACNIMLVSSGGRVENANVGSGGEIYLDLGAVLGGRLELENGAVVSAYDGAAVDFDLSRADSETALIDNLGMIAGAPEFTVTVSADTAEGVYLLASGASGFAGTITVQDDTMKYGVLSVDDPLVYGWNTYTLNLNGDALSLTVTRNAEEMEKNGEQREQLPTYDYRVLSGETLVVSEDMIYIETVVESAGTIIVRSGGRVENTHGGVLNVLSGGSAVRTGGAMVNVRSGGRATGISNAASIHIYEGGFAEDIVSVTSITVESGGRLIDTVTPYGEVTVSSGGVMENVQGSGVILYGLAKECHEGYYSIYSGGYTLNATNGFLGIYSGGVAEGTYMNNSLGQARITVYEGGLAKDTTMEKGTITVLNGGLLVGTELLGFRWYSDWQLEDTIIVSEGGVDWKTKNIRGVQHVVRGGVASETELTSMGIQHVSNGGLASETRLVDGGRLVVSRGGTARDVHAVSDGAVIVESLGLVQGITLDSNNIVLASSGARVEDANVGSGGDLYLLSGAILGGQVHLADGAAVSAFEGSFVDFDLSRANAETALIDNLGLITGAPLFTVTVSADTAEGVYLLASGASGFAGTITVQDETMKYGSLSVGNPLVYGWNTYTLDLNGDDLSLTVTRNAEEMGKNGEWRLHEVIYDVNVNPGDTLFVSDDAIYVDTRVAQSGTIIVQSGGHVEDTHVAGGTVTVLSGGSAVRTSGGAINVMDGGRITGATGGNIHIYGGGFAEDILSATSVTVESGGRLIDTVTPYGEITVSSGGVMENVQGSGVILYGLAKECHEGYYSIYSGGYTLNATNGFLGIYSGGVAEGTYMNNSLGQARITVYEGGLAKDTTMEKGTITVLNGGLLVGTELLGFRWYSDWQLEDTIIVSEGGVDWKTKNIRGVQHVVRGGVASETELTSMGIQHVSNGGLASETRLVDGGRLVVSRGGTARDIHVVSDGAVIVESLGFVQNIVLDACNIMLVSSGGRVENANVGSGGEIYLDLGAVLGGRLELENGAVVSAYDGAAVDFDLSRADSETALIDNLSVITGAPEFTATVSEDTAEGVYLLADGASGFTGTITVQDDAMKYGVLSVDNPLVYGWNTYMLNLNGDALSLTVGRNSVYHEPEPEPEEPEEIILVSSGTEVGETLVWEKTGEILRVAGGGILKDTDIPWGGTLVLEEGAVLNGTVRLGTDIQVLGPVAAEDATVELDISNRKEEYGIQLDNMMYVAALSYSVIVSPDQNKGEYILAGNAAGFTGTITVRDTENTEYGTLTLDQGTLDYDVTHYTLSLNEKDELTFIVSSNIPNEADYILLYKDNWLVLSRESAFGLTVSGDGEYDHMYILSNGEAKHITIGDGGLVTVEAGGTLYVKDQRGSLRFDYSEGDSTVIKGVNPYGAFYVADDRMDNVFGENLNVSGHVLISNYHGSGTLTTGDGVEMTGKCEGGWYDFHGTWIHDLVVLDTTIQCKIHANTVVTNSEWGALYVWIENGAYVENSVFNGSLLLEGGTISNLTFNSSVSIRGNVHVKSDLTFRQKPNYSGGLFDMYGHTVTMDYTERNRNDEPMINLNCFSEDVVFRLCLPQILAVGEYSIATGGRGFSDDYIVFVDGTTAGVLNRENPRLEYGNYIYTMTEGKNSQTGQYGVNLSVEYSDLADDSFSVYWYDTGNGFYYAKSVSGLMISGDEYPEVVVRNKGLLYDSELRKGGILKVRAGGRAVGLNFPHVGWIQCDYTEGDDTVITGISPYGSFFIRDNTIENMYCGNLTVSGNVLVNNYHGAWDDSSKYGILTTNGGVTVTGSLGTGDYFLNDTYIHDVRTEDLVIMTLTSCVLENGSFDGGSSLTLIGSTVSRSYFNFAVDMKSGTVSDSTFNSGVNLRGGTLSDVIINNRYYLDGNVFLDGDLYLNCAGTFARNACINANYHNIFVNFTDRKATDGGMISLNSFSEDVNFHLLFQKDQSIGTYTIAWNAGDFVDYFLMNIGGEDTEELSFENTEMDYGNYHYVMAHDVDAQIITLTIDISDDADDTFNLYYWDSGEKEFYHAASVDCLLFSADGYHDMVVRNGGLVTNSRLESGGLITVRAGGRVLGLNQGEKGLLRFEYTQGDTTEIKGVNMFGAFFVENDLLENVYGENITVNGDVLVRNYHNAGGSLTTDGARITGKFEGRGVFDFSNSTVYDLVVNGGTSHILEGTSVTGSTFNTACSVNGGAGLIEDTTFNAAVQMHGGTFSETVMNGGWEVKYHVCLDGDITFRSAGRISRYIYDSAVLDARGFTVNVDLTDRTVTDDPMLNLDRLYNAELRVVIDPGQLIGTYWIASYASEIGQGDPDGVYNWETNKWDYRGEVVGDLDGVISIYDSNGIEMAVCTVNGDTEYFGRYNYTVFVDANGNLKLKVGWNNREDVEYDADELESNDTQETATEITGGGAGAVSNLTIHSESDADWFKFELDSIGRKSSFIGIDFRQWAGDLDIDLYNLNGELIDYARSVTDNERLSLTGRTAGTYFLKVYGSTGNTNAYKLVYDLPEPIDLEDVYDSGDDKAHAYFLKRLEEKITLDACISRSDDQDYYMFILPEKGLVSDVITLTYDDEFGDLDLYLYDQNGKDFLMASTNTVGGQERLSLAGLKHGVYYAAVKSKDNSIGRYELVFDVNDRNVNPDRYENNNSLKKATKLYTLNGEKTIEGLSIHSETDIDYYSFSILEKGSADDSVTLACTVELGDLDLEILNAAGEVVACSRTAENEDTVSLKGLDVGDYYIRVYGYNNVANNYSLSWHVTNSALIPSDVYEGNEPILIREDQTISGLSIAKVREKDETREDTFRIVLEYDAWKRSRIILTDYRSDWEDGIAYVVRDIDGNVLMEGVDSEISLYGLEKGEYFLTLDAPNDDEYSEYSLIAQCLPDSDNAKDNTWSIFIYMAGDNNLEGAYLQELIYMQNAVLPENVEVYVLLDRSDDYFVGERNWTDTRVGKIRHSSGRGAVAVQWMYFDGTDTKTYMNTHNLELKREWDTGDVRTLEAFLDWGMLEGRADNYALIIKDHGTSLGYNCKDETDGSIMSIAKIAELLRKDKYDDLSVVAFDQCLMGSDVVVTTMEGTVDYVVASEAVGYTPNWLVMYKVLLNSFETEMTPQEVSQKIVEACNCSGLYPLTMASFNSLDNALSEALNRFGSRAAEFTFGDWVALFRAYRDAANYGDGICAYSDLGNVLNQVKADDNPISDALRIAIDDLYDTVMNTVIDSTMITPDIYGTGLAVFNPVLSSPMMALYSYGAGCPLDYYATEIGQTVWGEFQYKLSKISDECSLYVVDDSNHLTFTSSSFFFTGGRNFVSYDLGAFSGNGMTYEGLYMDQAVCFGLTLEQPGIEGDAIVVTADNPDADLTIYLVQTMEDGTQMYRRTSENGVLPLDGVNYEKAHALNDYNLIITSTAETTYTLKLVAEWSNGVDFFDYSRTGSISPLAAGNNSVDKATQLPTGNYGGLMTYAGDKDYYKILSVYADRIDVTVKGTGLVVREFDAAGELLQTAAEDNGAYRLTVAKDNYVCVEGTADITLDECNSYMLSISDAAQTYLKAELNAILPEKPVVTSELVDNTVSISVEVGDGLRALYSKDLFEWREYGDGLVATENERYYFKAVDTETGLESQYISLRVEGIDHELPVVGNIVASVPNGQTTNEDVMVTAEFSDNTAVDKSLYRIGEDGEWLDYVDGVTVTENATVFFKAVDPAGNESEIVSYEVGNIDKVAPVIELAGDNVTPLQQSTLTASTEPGLEIFYSTDNETWTKYEGELEVKENATYYFKATDAAGNVGLAEYVFGNIDTVAPVKPVASADIVAFTNKDVTVTAEFSADSVKKEYSLDGGATWNDYDVNGIIIINNGTVLFHGIDAAGNVSEVESFMVSNIDKAAPAVPSGLNAVVVDRTVTLSWSASTDDLAGVKEYTVVYSHDGQEFTLTTAETTLVLENADFATWQWSVLAVDSVGNISGAASGDAFTVEQPGTSSGFVFFPGRFAGGAKSMFAAQAKDSSRVSIYTEGSGWGTDLELDPGWKIAGVGDFDADGRDDFLRLNDEGYVVGEMTQADGTFAAQVLNFRSPGWSILGTGDFNGNGSDDVLIAHPTAASETVGLLGYWESGVTWTLINGYSAEWSMIATGDFNGDGKCDMLWKNEFIGDGGLTYNAFCTWIVEDPVDWRMVSVANPAEWNFLCAGDFDGDGMNDIAMINDVGVVGIWGVTDGYLSSWSILSAVDTSAWTLAGVGDFNADGTDDIAWSSNETGLTGYWQINDKQLTTWANIATIS